MVTQTVRDFFLPYSATTGQDELRLALEVSFVASQIQGVLLSGERGTGKSTTVRAFSLMMHGALPVTIPINATEDRVVGGWEVEALMKGDAVPQKGLIEEAHDAGGMLYVDEVNLLDDHIVNILLDVTANGVLEVQREGRVARQHVRVALIGTMNPEEGGLRPQLLDRFALMVNVRTEPQHGREVLRQVLNFDHARANPQEPSTWLQDLRAQDAARREYLIKAKDRLPPINDETLDRCVNLTAAFKCDGHRGALVLAQAAQACSAIRGHDAIEPEDLRAVAPLALQHRIPGVSTASQGSIWSEEQQFSLERMLG